VIKGIHGLFYTSKPEELRAFIRDKLKLPYTDTGGGWLIFDLEEGDLGVHPTEGRDSLSGSHNISFFTDDVKGTVAELEARGVKFDDAITDQGYGLVTHFTMPGGVRVQLYEPRYQKQSLKPRTKVTVTPRAAREKEIVGKRK
jgi:predicted enzyme related to lactoylglutathione lyase